MVYLENEKKVRYNPYHMKKDKKIGDGSDADVYLIKGMAVKFYYDGFYSSGEGFTKRDIDKMSGIETKRILLPKSPLLDKKRNVRGYKMTYVNDLGIDNFFNLNKRILQDEMKILDSDISVVSDNSIILSNIAPNNTVYNNGIYLINPGSYLLNSDNIFTEGLNRDVFDEYLIDLLINYCENDNDDIFKEIFKKYIYTTYGDLLEYLANNFEFLNMGDFAKENYRRVKQLCMFK